MHSIAPGNQINAHDGYVFETTEVNRGTKRFSVLAVAIVDPERPSRDLPFIFPSRQRGRKDKMARFPVGIYITRVGVRVHKSIKLEPDNYQIGSAIGNPLNISLPYIPPTAPLVNTFDYSVGWAMAESEDFGRKRVEQQQEALAGSKIQLVTESSLASGALVAEAPILSDPTVANGDPLAAPWEPHFLMPGVANAPTTHNGHRSAIILDVSGFILDPAVADYETATAGMGYLLEV